MYRCLNWVRGNILSFIVLFLYFNICKCINVFSWLSIKEKILYILVLGFGCNMLKMIVKICLS